MPTQADIARYRANMQDEIDSALLYRAVAQSEKQPQLAQVYNQLAEAEEKHTRFWEEQLKAAGAITGPITPSWRARTLAWLARRFGASFVLPTITGLEQQDSRGYAAQSESRASSLPAEERSHARILQQIASGTRGGLEGSAVATLEGRHRSTGGNALRAAVLGANDGLVSNLSLIMGVAGAANLSEQPVIIAGLAGLLAGAISMAMGEWLSVQSSRELYEKQIRIEAAEIEQLPAEEKQELALIYQAKGLPEQEARRVAEHLISDTGTALDTLAREELGIDPEELGGSALEAAVASFILFALGAIIPLFPFILWRGLEAVAWSLVVSAVGLFAIGASITLLTGRSVLFSGTRQVLFGLAAAGVTFGIGRIVGVSIGG